MGSENLGRLLFLSLFALAVYLMFLIFKPFLAGIAWACVLAIAFYPLHERLVRLVRGRAFAAAVLMSFVVAAVIVLPTVYALVKVGQGVAQGYDWLQVAVEKNESPFDLVRQKVPWVASALDTIDGYVDLDTIDLKSMTLSSLRTVGNAIAGKTRALVANAIATVLTLIVMLVTMAVLFQEGPRIVGALRRILPLREEDRDEVIEALRAVTRAVFFGVILTAFAQGVLGGIGTAIVSLPSPVTFGAAMFFAALLPSGAAIVWVPAAVWLAATGHPWRALILALWGALIVSMADNILRPYFIGKGVRMHTLLVFFGIFGGMLAFGMVGLFIGPLVITSFLFLFEIARRDIFRDALPAKPPVG